MITSAWLAQLFMVRTTSTVTVTSTLEGDVGLAKEAQLNLDLAFHSYNELDFVIYD